MAQIRGYIATSLDGFIADADHGVGWLDDFDGSDFGYEAFIADIGCVVMGRKSFDFVDAYDGDWPYPGKDVVLATHRKVVNPPPQSHIWAGDDVRPLINELRQFVGGDVWVVGGSDLLHQFRQAGGLDTLEIFTMPVLLGGGVPLWLSASEKEMATLVESAAMDLGVVRSVYRF
ncbi:dihydrofolate reductase family protein [Parvibaculaceae bacterium PLY_AMNH_Bact1]|nr:dihydrofolate reductase family protein [Parvibaculaceae bacterium PLY_AMNH_Bact1]